MIHAFPESQYRPASAPGAKARREPNSSSAPTAAKITPPTISHLPRSRAGSMPTLYARCLRRTANRAAGLQLVGSQTLGDTHNHTSYAAGALQSNS